MASNEDANGAHEKCYCWKCKNIVSYVPGSGVSPSYVMTMSCFFSSAIPIVPAFHIPVAFFGGERVALKLAA
jgi:hypothetical protein